ncbi:hypothetical protein XHV734_2289 [Xanthomonas hortorum pv. vitians]|nr:hypothetical protein XHV734_2289 [Xanthomonas hortorum pv. vitians]
MRSFPRTLTPAVCGLVTAPRLLDLHDRFTPLGRQIADRPLSDDTAWTSKVATRSGRSATD